MKSRFLLFKFLLLGFALIFFNIPISAQGSEIEPCELATPLFWSHASVSYNRDQDIVKSIGRPRILSIAVDFTDAVLTDSPNNAISKIVDLTTVSEFYRFVSGGKFEPIFDVYPKILRLPKSSIYYGSQADIDSFSGERQQSEKLIRDAIYQLPADFVPDEYSAVIIFITGGKSLSGYVGLTYLQDRGFFSLAKGEIHNFTLIGAGISINGPTYAARVVVHEVGHLIGLPDLYSYDPNGYWLYNSPSIFSFMGSLQGNESDTLAWNRFILRWIDESQVYCAALPPKSMTIKLSNKPENETGKYKLVLIKLSEFRLLAIESLPEKGFFASSKSGGFLVYEVDTSRDSGQIPIKIIPREIVSKLPITSQKSPDWLRLVNAPLTTNSYLTYEGIRLENIQNPLYGSVLRIFSGDSAVDAGKTWAKNNRNEVSKITCVRGKSIRIISGEALKCPIGYVRQFN